MALSFIGAATSVSSTATMPAHEPGDLLIVFASRTATSVIPTAVAGWTSVYADGANTIGWRVAYKIAASDAEVVGTWTNAAQMIVLVYRGAVSPYIGTPVAQTGAGGGTVAFGEAALGAADGSRWVLALAGARTISSSVDQVPAAMTLRASRAGNAGEIAAFDSGTPVNEWLASTGGNALTANWKTLVIDIIGAAPLAPISADVAVTVGAVAIAATGLLGVKADASVMLGTTGIVATAATAIRADASVTAGAVTVAATGQVIGNATVGPVRFLSLVVEARPLILSGEAKPLTFAVQSKRLALAVEG